MIYTSHYFSGKIKGQPVGISLFTPRGFEGEHLHLFAPTHDIFRFWKSSAYEEEDWTEYKRRYRQLMISKWSDVKEWLQSLTMDQEMTLLCYPEKYCHRHLVGMLIEKHRPELWGREVE